ncbi:extracellular solute-binding protein [Microbacterium oxydans]|jgi:multiple sugar transport system substrate-binding protein|uniref:extracellular solute-binding protein n=1 Tax=Microbacterium TaxID=33882 RepID=UPI000DE4B864|nr:MULTISPECIES: extracellular solute-binding protein [unclassified Microbacterium]MBE7952753.1 extracellular solute-binding protein [Microbacterium sp. R1]NYF26567.1 multiple sugar transport system substrate-binding protein [Microbacterium sp. JAI119]RBO71717.1 sugar ABC transporter substrate-binding protein [Microbacterium sp. H6]
MKKLRAIALIGATALIATGCSAGGGGGEGSADGTGPISIWLSNNEQELAWGTAVVEAWNAEHPDEKVKAQEIPAGSSSEEAITAAITAGTAPCLVYNVAPAAVSGWVKQGGLVDLSKIDGGSDYITERGGEVDAYASDGSFYQLPWKSNPVMVMYNKALFQAAGIDPEEPQMNTYDAFLEGSRAIVASGVQSAIWPAPTSEFYQPWFDFYPLYLAETDGTMLVEDGKSTFDSDAGRTVSEFWKTFYDEKLSPNEASTDDAMSAGTTAMQLAGPWAIPSYADTVDVGFMPVPTSDGREAPTTFADSKSVSMFTACKNQGTAWEFLKFSTSEDSDGQLLEATGQMPMRTGLTDTYGDYFAANPNYVAFAEQAEKTADVPSIPNSVEAWQAFRDEYSSAVIFDKESIDDFLGNAAKKIDALVAE